MTKRPKRDRGRQSRQWLLLWTTHADAGVLVGGGSSRRPPKTRRVPRQWCRWLGFVPLLPRQPPGHRWWRRGPSFLMRSTWLYIGNAKIRRYCFIPPENEIMKACWGQSWQHCAVRGLLAVGFRLPMLGGGFADRMWCGCCWAKKNGIGIGTSGPAGSRAVDLY